jgi:hypothetical protein
MAGIGLNHELLGWYDPDRFPKLHSTQFGND